MIVTLKKVLLLSNTKATTAAAATTTTTAAWTRSGFGLGRRSATAAAFGSAGTAAAALAAPNTAVPPQRRSSSFSYSTTTATAGGATNLAVTNVNAAASAAAAAASAAAAAAVEAASKAPFSSSSAAAAAPQQQDNDDDDDDDCNLDENNKNKFKLTVPMAMKVTDRTYEKLKQNGTIWNTRLETLRSIHDETNADMLQKWSSMMELLCDAKSSTIDELGYYKDSGTTMEYHHDDKLTQYTNDLEELTTTTTASTMQSAAAATEGVPPSADDTVSATATTQQQQQQQQQQQLLDELERKQIRAWNYLVSSCFRFDAETDVPAVTLEDARNICYKVHAAMIEPHILDSIHDEAADLTFAYPNDPDRVAREKHAVAQEKILYHVYGIHNPYFQGPTVIEQYGFAPPRTMPSSAAEDDDDDDDDVKEKEGTAACLDLEKGYAIMQCSLYPYRNDPFIQQITMKTMAQVWQAALDFVGGGGRTFH